ncbi:hypothetical protein LNTAR_18615 [Lentisphaera araneosa HTCC2155]|uniref:DUF5077 domain-containing protein n=1 Tax=Lentisphaera araneosa HTCC2155 TaxID=313628 RepID=A6DNM9_9BACT|nr:hypothetical protein [Lentisphaera araneosa]EDM26688.1 hypothetical protein LNTAR_18615 [Lentisphaera araneosa HTCC2155]
MKVVYSLIIIHLCLVSAIAKTQYLFNGKQIQALKTDDFSLKDNVFQGQGNLSILTDQLAVQVDIMVEALSENSSLSVDQQKLAIDLPTKRLKHINFTYRRLANEQKSIRVPEKPTIYFGDASRFNPEYFNGSHNENNKANEIVLNFNSEVKIHRMRIIPINSFSLKEFFIMKAGTKKQFTHYNAELYKSRCFECHGEKMMVPTKASLRGLKRSLASHAQLYKYIKQHRDLNDFTSHSLAWYINNHILKTHQKSLYRTYSKSHWQKLPNSLYSIDEFLQKKEAAEKLQFTLKADQGELINQGEARLINGALEFWNDSQTWIKWQVELKHPGFVNVSIEQAFPHDELAEYSVNIGAQELSAKVVKTENWTAFQKVDLGKIYINKAGTYTVTIVPKTKPGIAVMNLSQLKISGLPVFNLDQSDKQTVFHYKIEKSKSYASLEKTPTPQTHTNKKSSIQENHSTAKISNKNTAPKLDNINLDKEKNDVINEDIPPKKTEGNLEYIYI